MNAGHIEIVEMGRYLSDGENFFLEYNEAEVFVSPHLHRFIEFGSRNFDISLAFNSTTNMQGFLQDVGRAESFNYASEEASRKKLVTKSMDRLLETILQD